MVEYIEKSQVERMLWAVIMSKDERTIEEMLEDATIVNAIPIPDNVNNGDMVEKIFGKDIFLNLIAMMYVPCCKKLDKWWNEPYQKGAEE